MTSEPASVLSPAAGMPQKASLRSLAVHDPSTFLHALPKASVPILQEGQAHETLGRTHPGYRFSGESGMSACTSVMLETRVSLDIEPIQLTRSDVSLVWGSKEIEVEPKLTLFFF